MLSLETDRLVVRSFRSEDWQDLQEMCVNHMATEVAKLEDPWPTSTEEVRGIVAWFASGDDYLAVCLKDTNKLVGMVAIERRASHAGKWHNLGYDFNPEYHGRGYATEACRATMAHVFGALSADGILTGTRRENVTSVRLLRRLGLREKESAPGEFAISRDEWLTLERVGS